MIELHKFTKSTWILSLIGFVLIFSSCHRGDSMLPAEASKVSPMLTEVPAEISETSKPSTVILTLEITMDETEYPTQAIIVEDPEENDESTYTLSEFEWTDIILYETGFPGGLFAISSSSLEIFKFLDGRPVFLSSDQKFACLYTTNMNIQTIDLKTGAKGFWTIQSQCLGEISMFPNKEWIAISCNYDIWVVPNDANDKTLEILAGDLDYHSPQVSPNGEFIVSWGHSQALVPDSASGMYISELSCTSELDNCEVLTAGPYFPKQSSGFAAWSNDNRFIAISLEKFDGSIKIFDVERKIIIDELKIDAREIGGIAWSPDGNNLAFGTENGLYVINIESQDIEQLLEVKRPNDILVRGWISN